MTMKHGNRGGAVPTLNAFDVGDTRATVLILGVDFYNATTDERNFHTLRSGGANEGKPGVLILDGTRVDDVRVIDTGIVPTVISRWGTGGGNVPAIAFSVREDAKANNFSATETETALTLQGHQPSPQSHHAQLFLAETSTVRRLTPTECERLQGFPDGWTEGQADSNRYKQMGNAVAVPVVEWIIKRLVETE
jgi:DNA (cytosine-5)-methyltransferase 1